MFNFLLVFVFALAFTPLAASADESQRAKPVGDKPLGHAPFAQSKSLQDTPPVLAAPPRARMGALSTQPPPSASLGVSPLSLLKNSFVDATGRATRVRGLVAVVRSHQELLREFASDSHRLLEARSRGVNAVLFQVSWAELQAEPNALDVRLSSALCQAFEFLALRNISSVLQVHQIAMHDSDCSPFVPKWLLSRPDVSSRVGRLPPPPSPCSLPALSSLYFNPSISALFSALYSPNSPLHAAYMSFLKLLSLRFATAPLVALDVLAQPWAASKSPLLSFPPPGQSMLMTFYAAAAQAVSTASPSFSMLIEPSIWPRDVWARSAPLHLGASGPMSYSGVSVSTACWSESPNSQLVPCADELLDIFVHDVASDAASVSAALLLVAYPLTPPTSYAALVAASQREDVALFVPTAAAYDVFVPCQKKKVAAPFVRRISGVVVEEVWYEQWGTFFVAFESEGGGAADIFVGPNVEAVDVTGALATMEGVDVHVRVADGEATTVTVRVSYGCGVGH